MTNYGYEVYLDVYKIFLERETKEGLTEKERGLMLLIEKLLKEMLQMLEKTDELNRAEEIRILLSPPKTSIKK